MPDALSPLDGRYRADVEPVRARFSESALMRARLFIEAHYLLALAREPKVKELPPFDRSATLALWKIVDGFSPRDAARIKAIERKTRHDVKAVELFLREEIKRVPMLAHCSSFIHFALTSEDVNNLAYGLILHDALRTVILPSLKTLEAELAALGRAWKAVPMLSLTHGQPATPTTVGAVFLVFVERLARQRLILQKFRMHGKLGGAVGTFAAHRAAYPEVNWGAFGRRFVSSLNLLPLTHTTQINPHDDLAELSHVMERVNAILLNLTRDLWLYIARGVFAQKVVKGEVGSSAMPHKVNPIDFENAEGNLGLSTALFAHFAQKLPVSRLQRDLSDSTVQRNIGIAFGYHYLAVRGIARGLSRIALDPAVLRRELQEHPEVVTEAIQTILRKYGRDDAYEKLKTLARGRRIPRAALEEYIAHLQISAADRSCLLSLLP